MLGGDSYCNSCIDYHLPFLSEMGNAIGGSNIILLFKNVSVKQLIMLKNNQKLNFIIASTIDKTQNIGIPIEEENTPCYMVITDKLEISASFYPIKELPNYNKNYYSFILTLFNKKTE